MRGSPSRAFCRYGCTSAARLWLLWLCLSGPLLARAQVADTLSTRSTPGTATGAAMGNPTVSPPLPDTAKATVDDKRTSRKKRREAEQEGKPGGRVRQQFSITGSLSAYAGLYATSLPRNRNQATPFGLAGYATINLPGGISIPFSATFGNQGAVYRQPFNQFGVSPTYRWITLHAGYRNVVFSPFTLAGHTFLGGGVELNPGILRVGFVYGRFNRAVESDLANPDVLPAYTRTGYAAKLGLGRGANYIDALVMRAADDTSSIKAVPDTARNAVRPAENLVVGLSGRARFLRYFTLEGDAALSAYTRDMRAKAVSFDDSGSLARWAENQNFITLRQTTQLTTAVQLGAGYMGRYGGLKVNYRRLDPNFQTMGAYFFQSDLVSYTLSPTLILFQSKVRLSGSYGWQEDNLYRNKAATSRRTIGSAALSLNPGPKFGLDLSYSNYGIGQTPGRRPIIDTVRLAQNNSTITGNVRYALLRPAFQQVFTVTVSRQQLADNNRTTARLTESNNTILSFGYFYQPVKAGIGFNGTVSYTNTVLPRYAEGVGTRSYYYGPTLGATLQQFEQRLNVAGNLSYLISEVAGEVGQIVTLTGSTTYKLPQRQSLSLQYVYLYSNQGSGQPAFNETRLTLVYGISLSARPGGGAAPSR